MLDNPLPATKMLVTVQWLEFHVFLRAPQLYA